MCLEGKRTVSGYYFDSLPHPCFCLHPDVPGEIKRKDEQVKCLWVEILEDFLVAGYETKFQMFAYLKYKIFEF